MRVTRAKQYRRHLRFFRIVYGISAPYKVSFERESPMIWHESITAVVTRKLPKATAGSLGIGMDLTVQ